MTSKKEKPLHSLVAGTTAGAIEAFVTYPTEFVKTRTQFSARISTEQEGAEAGMGEIVYPTVVEQIATVIEDSTYLTLEKLGHWSDIQRMRQLHRL